MINDPENTWEDHTLGEVVRSSQQGL